MTNIAATAPIQPKHEADTIEDVTRGWYCYGITRRGSVAALFELLHNESSHAAPLQLLELSELAAVVRPVLLNDFSSSALRERLESPSGLEGMVRSHNDVIEAIHALQPILPAKFGMVHARAEDVLSALRSDHDALLQQLNLLAGCDEWAVHLYVDCAIVREQISVAHPAIRQLREKRASARPGRAYFLEQQIRDESRLAIDSALSALGQATFDRLSFHAVDGQVSPLAPIADFAGELEILRASFLVGRECVEAFEDEVRSSNTCDGLRCEQSGPWPPYSFAAATAGAR